MSANFNGSLGNYLTLNSPGTIVSALPVTIAALVRPANTTAFKGVFQSGAAGAAGGTGIGFELNTSALVETQTNGSTSSIAGTTYVANQWQLIVVSWTSANVWVYVYRFDTRAWARGNNGVTQGTPSAPNSGVGWIGAWSDASLNPTSTDAYNGDIDWVGVWGSDLSVGGITIPPRVSDLVYNGPWEQSRGQDCKFFISLVTDTAFRDTSGNPSVSGRRGSQVGTLTWSPHPVNLDLPGYGKSRKPGRLLFSPMRSAAGPAAPILVPKVNRERDPWSPARKWAAIR